MKADSAVMHVVITSGCLCLSSLNVAIPGCHDRVSGSAPGLLLYLAAGREDMGSVGSLIGDGL